MTDKEKRIYIVNQIIQEIGNRGRKFFHNPKRYGYAQFVLEGRTLWFVDDYTGEKIYPYMHRTNHRGFSHGGTLWALVNDFREFIITGEKVNGTNGYGGLRCPNWGYPEEDMREIASRAKELGYL